MSDSIKRLRELEETTQTGASGLTKKELLNLTRERDKLELALGGIKDMRGTPDLMVVVDTNKESIALAEARKLGIPVIAIVDSNSDPDGIDIPIPGNDDAGRAITLYCDLIAKAAIDGIERAAGSSGVDIGEAVEPQVDTLPDEGASEGGDASADLAALAGEADAAAAEAGSEAAGDSASGAAA